MGSAAFQDLRINPEFSNLIAPLSENEYQILEESICQEGCREPIVVWGNIIVDGHNRFHICTEHGIDFRTVRIHFSDREEAISWICATQLGRRNISEETRKYLIGKRYNAEKFIRRRKVHTSPVFRTLNADDEPTEQERLDQKEKLRKNPTAEYVAGDYHLAHSTVEKYANYSRALDSIGRLAFRRAFKLVRSPHARGANLRFLVWK